MICIACQHGFDLHAVHEIGQNYSGGLSALIAYRQNSVQVHAYIHLDAAYIDHLTRNNVSCRADASAYGMSVC